MEDNNNLSGAVQTDTEFAVVRICKSCFFKWIPDLPSIKWGSYCPKCASSKWIQMELRVLTDISFLDPEQVPAGKEESD